MAKEIIHGFGPVIGIGEALFDIFPDGREVLGGAPLNVAVMMSQLGLKSTFVGGIGSDAHGNRILAELHAFNVGTEFIQVSGEYPTGTVQVELLAGQPSYTIIENVAWDHLLWNDSLELLSNECCAVCFGTLAQRSEKSRETIRRFLRHAHRAWRLFDLNLRQQYWQRNTIQAGINLSDATKLNSDELPLVMTALSLKVVGDEREDAHTLHRETSHPVFLTRGERGTAGWVKDEWIEGKPFSVAPAVDDDPVGAGDACSAAIIYGRLSGLPWQETLNLANRVGAFVASSAGATPKLNLEAVDN
jgi:fructokinase